ncbi:MAG: cohesin domain-containing protein [Candidatus Bathyarchaeota archaeon]|nr:cohesin domain-containing protein [Candidatus Bathyarchaeota archaeon]
MLLLLVSLLVIANVPILTKVYAQTTTIIKVEPEINIRSPYAVWPNYVNKTFKINVTLNDVTSEQELVAAQFYLTYNKTLLEVVSVTEGPFFQDPRWNLAGTFFISFVEVLPDGSGVVKYMDMIYPNLTTGNYDDWTIFPNGNGTIATITFKSIYQPIAPQSSESCDLGITETMLLDSGANEISHDFQSGTYEVIPLQIPRTAIDVSIDVGKIYFKGEIAEFYILTSDYGKAVDTTEIKAYLYYDGTLFASLTDAIEHVTTGLYMISYSIPSDAEPGTYTLLVEAEFFEAKGTNINSFLISSTFEQLEAFVAEINDDIATIILPDLNQIKLNLTAIDAKLIDLQGTTAVINSTLGKLKVNIETINATITNLIISNGEILADIDTSLGHIVTELQNVSTTLAGVDDNIASLHSFATIGLSVASIFSAIAAVAAVAVLILLRKSPK